MDFECLSYAFIGLEKFIKNLISLSKATKGLFHYTLYVLFPAEIPFNHWWFHFEYPQTLTMDCSTPTAERKGSVQLKFTKNLFQRTMKAFRQRPKMLNRREKLPRDSAATARSLTKYIISTKLKIPF